MHLDRAETETETEAEKGSLYVPRHQLGTCSGLECSPFFPAGLRRPEVPMTEVRVEHFLDSEERARWVGMVLAVLALAVILGTIGGALGSQAMLESEPEPDVSDDAIATAMPGINGTTAGYVATVAYATTVMPDEPRSGLKMGHWSLLGITQVIVTLQALFAHAEVFFQRGWDARRIKRSLSLGLSVTEVTAVNALLCAAHCSSDPASIKPYLLATWISYLLGGVFLSSHLGVPHAVISDFAEDDKKTPPFSDDWGDYKKNKPHWVLACFMPAHWSALVLPSQLVHQERKERPREKWGVSCKDVALIGSSMGVLAVFGLAMIIICEDYATAEMENNHWLALVTLLASIPAFSRRSLELTRHFSVRPLIGWGSQAVFSFSAMMTSCMSSGWGLAASLVVLQVWARSSTFSVSVVKRKKWSFGRVSLQDSFLFGVADQEAGVALMEFPANKRGPALSDAQEAGQGGAYQPPSPA